ncbi:MAG: serB [Burkholderiaceae bacterium]|nr:serB [Burkholderiaceae bacterium]
MKIVIQHPEFLSESTAHTLLKSFAGTPVRVNEKAYAIHNTLFTPAQKCELIAAAQVLSIDVACLERDVTWADFKVLAMDMDSTLINIECIDEIADLAGKKAEVASITEASMRGEIKDFNESLIRRMAFFAGTPFALLDDVLRERLRVNEGAHALIRAAQAHGVKCVLVSGGFTYFAEQVQKELNLDAIHANTLEIIDGRITGKVIGEIVNGNVKARFVHEHCEQLQVNTLNAIAMGDGSNDLPMMSISGLSVAYRAKPMVQERAMITLNFVGLDGLAVVLGG